MQASAYNNLGILLEDLRNMSDIILQPWELLKLSLINGS